METSLESVESSFCFFCEDIGGELGVSGFLRLCEAGRRLEEEEIEEFILIFDWACAARFGLFDVGELVLSRERQERLLASIWFLARFADFHPTFKSRWKNSKR